MSWVGDDSESVAIHSSKTGKKLCEIEAPQKWHWPIPLLPIVIYRHDVWKDPEAVKRWAWRQSFHIVQSIRELTLISRQTRCHCLVCDNDSITPVYGRLWAKDSIIGFRCTNKRCSVFKVRIPFNLTLNLMDMPQDLFAECLTTTGQTTVSIWTSKDKK